MKKASKGTMRRKKRKPSGNIAKKRKKKEKQKEHYIVYDVEARTWHGTEEGFAAMERGEMGMSMKEIEAQYGHVNDETED
tara:strand:- start:471 stop:710 length:240 start_codon:yes stop_codon:yes gene_type:complete